MNIVILAAGMGKRMRSQLPKVLQPLAGKALLDHVLSATAQLQASKQIVVVGHGAQEVKARYEDRTDLVFVMQMPQLGTGHALQVAYEALDLNASHTLVCLGDVPLLSAKTLRALSEEATRSELVLLTVKLDNPQGYGRIVRDEFGRVASIVEEKDATAEQKAIQEVNTGIMMLPTARLQTWLSALKNNNAQAEYYLTDVIHLAATEGVSISTVHPEFVYEVEGVNSKAQLAKLERTWQLAQAEQLLDQGVTLIDPQRIDIRGHLTCGQDVLIDVNNVFEGTVTLEDGVTIGPNCFIRNATIKAGTVIAPFTHIDDAYVGPQCSIGPYARLRPKARLQGYNHIGNFVEVKKSTVDQYSKINHLTYIGDSVIGKRVNVGAGTITCNYNGVEKFQTTIEDDAFIGSGTQLVAPVTVGQGATIGAGTTVTQDAPAHQLTVGRARAQSYPNWKRPIKK